VVARFISLMFSVPANFQIMAMPSIIIPSDAPTIISVFLAAAELSSSYPLINLYKVNPKTPQKTRNNNKLSAPGESILLGT